MWKPNTNLSTRRETTLSLPEMNNGFIKQWKLLPYSMHYWYFNVIDPAGSLVSSYILARSETPTILNGRHVKPEPDVYTGVYIDFLAKTTEVTPARITTADDMLRSDDLEFGIRGRLTHFRFRDKSFTFNNVLPDCYRANFWNIYEWYSYNCNSDNYYLVGNNAIIRGPLAPWNWLHFYFEDGTRVKVFSAVGQRKMLEINDLHLPLNTITQDVHTITYNAGSDDCTFELTLNKGYCGTLTYTPRWSPTWQYDQIGVTFGAVKTNLPNFNAQQTGRGILEVAQGYSL